MHKTLIQFNKVSQIIRTCKQMSNIEGKHGFGKEKKNAYRIQPHEESNYEGSLQNAVGWSSQGFLMAAKRFSSSSMPELQKGNKWWINIEKKGIFLFLFIQLFGNCLIPLVIREKLKSVIPQSFPRSAVWIMPLFQ